MGLWERTVLPDKNERLVTIGLVRKAVGLDGRLEVELYSNDISRLAAGTTLLLGGNPFTVEKASPGRKNLFAVYFHGVSDRTTADQLRGLDIAVRESELPPPPEGVYYHYQLIDSRVVDRGGRQIGTLSGIMETGSNDVYVVKSDDGNEVLIPATKGTIVNIDIVKGEVVVDLPQNVADAVSDANQE